jgi:uncharacterized protein YgiB involved in biofilm formation
MNSMTRIVTGALIAALTLSNALAQGVSVMPAKQDANIACAQVDEKQGGWGEQDGKANSGCAPAHRVGQNSTLLPGKTNPVAHPQDQALDTGHQTHSSSGSLLNGMAAGYLMSQVMGAGSSAPPTTSVAPNTPPAPTIKKEEEKRRGSSVAPVVVAHSAGSSGVTASSASAAATSATANARVNTFSGDTKASVLSKQSAFASVRAMPSVSPASVHGGASAGGAKASASTSAASHGTSVSRGGFGSSAGHASSGGG